VAIWLFTWHPTSSVIAVSYLPVDCSVTFFRSFRSSLCLCLSHMPLLYNVLLIPPAPSLGLLVFKIFRTSMRLLLEFSCIVGMATLESSVPCVLLHSCPVPSASYPSAQSACRQCSLAVLKGRWFIWLISLVTAQHHLRGGRSLKIFTTTKDRRSFALADFVLIS
jgi:hypothetical protein